MRSKGRFSDLSCGLIADTPRDRAVRFRIHIGSSRSCATRIFPHSLCFDSLPHAAPSVPIPKFASFRGESVLRTSESKDTGSLLIWCGGLVGRLYNILQKASRGL